MSIARHLATTLGAHSSLTLGSNLFYGNEPARAEIGTGMLTLYDTGAGEQDARNALNIDTIQVRARAKTYQRAAELQGLVRAELEGKREDIATAAERIFGIICTRSPETLGQQDNGDAVFVASYEILSEPKTKAERA